MSVENLKFKYDVDVSLVSTSSADMDASVAMAARVSTAGSASHQELLKDSATQTGLIRYLMKSRHGTPFEHNQFTFLVSAPLFVFREFQRHRTFSYNEESGRYKELDPVFYIPPTRRKVVQVGKPGHYTFEEGTAEQKEEVQEVLTELSVEAYKAYEYMLEVGIAREVARMCLPLNIFSSMYATCNARSLMHFLSLRTENDNAAFPSKPQWEIQLVADKMEAIFVEKMPIVHKAFNDFGRVAP